MVNNDNHLPIFKIAMLLALCSWLLAGCGGDGGGEDGAKGGEGGEGAEGFETAWPGADGRSSGDGAESTSGDAIGGFGVPGAANSATADDGADATRAIQEADIIQVDGDRVFALSRMSGLSVVDIGDPSELRLVGAYRDTRDAQPFEMYLQGDVALVMFSSWGRYERIEDAAEGEPAYAWVQTSELVALDVSDPAKVALLGSFDIPGSISDSRIVGDVLYIVGYEDGYCWSCEEGKPRTAVISLDVSDPKAIRKVDELAFADDDNAWGWNQRSVTVTSQRMYVAGPEYGNDGPVGSSIQVVDISDPAGDMVLGATVQAAGQVSSRWQMDEYEGVLRVISQPPQWRLSDPPVIQTFTVVSSDEVTPLGSTEMRLPRPEQLQSLRFDGLRAYAITFERTDPLFTIDLSEPEAPVQRGELEIPGFVYHMEPRGERLVGLGFDQGNSEGAVTVSLFDVSDLDNPSQIARVNFGGNWASLPEDQNRIHKVFRVLDEAGLILVPYSGSEEVSEGDLGCGFFGGSHVQLVDFTLDSLELQGSLPTRGEARRAFLHGEHVFTVSDQEVAAFDASDRSAPTEAGKLALARNVTRALPLANDVIARFSDDWWSEASSVDFVHVSDAELPSAGSGEINLSDMLGGDNPCTGYFWIYDVVADGERMFVLYERETYPNEHDASGERDYKAYGGLLVVDAADPMAPQVEVKQEWPREREWWWYGGHYAHGIPFSDRGVLPFEGGIAMLEQGYVQDEDGDDSREQFRVRVVALDGAEPKISTVALDRHEGYFGLTRSGDTLVTSHYEPVAGRTGITRFYMDRIDVSDPEAPTLLDKVNVPGVVMHHNAEDGTVVTMDLVRGESEDGLTWQECAKRFAVLDFDNQDDWRTPEGLCTGYQQFVRLVTLGEDGAATLQDSFAIEQDRALRRLSVGEGRLVGTIGRGEQYGYGIAGDIAIDCFGPCGPSVQVSEPEQLIVLSGMAEGTLRAGTLTLEADADPWYGWWGASQLVAAGERALVTSKGELAVIDLSDPENPELERVEAFSGYAQNVAVGGNRVALALGAQGCRVIDL